MLSFLGAIGQFEATLHRQKSVVPEIITPKFTMPSSSNEEFSLDEQFNAAVDIVHAMPKEGPVHTGNDEKLDFYSLYKQATLGPVTTSRPGIWNIIERYKWDAWKRLGDMDSDTAKRLYLKKMQRKIDDVSERYGRVALFVLGTWLAKKKNKAEERLRYNFVEWLCGDDYERMEPILRTKFRAIGRELIKADEDIQEAAVALKKTIDEQAKLPEPRPTSRNSVNATNTESAAALSDMEYCDAVEETESRGSLYGNHRTQESLAPEIQSLGSQLVRVAEAVERLAAFVTKSGLKQEFEDF